MGKNYIIKSTSFFLAEDVDNPKKAEEDFSIALSEGTVGAYSIAIVETSEDPMVIGDLAEAFANGQSVES